MGVDLHRPQSGKTHRLRTGCAAAPTFEAIRNGNPRGYRDRLLAESSSTLRLREGEIDQDSNPFEERRAAREAEIYRAAVHGAPAARRTFAAVAASYLEHGGPHTAATLARVRRLLLHLGAALLADDVDQARLDTASTALLRARPATRLREVITLARAVLTHGARRRMCSVPMYEAGRASPSRTNWPTAAEVDALAAAAARHLQPLIVFLAGTGARLGEALALDWSDVDLQHGRAVLRETKNGADRIVDLCPRVLAALQVDSRPAKRRGRPLERTGRVFRTYAGAPYAEKAVQGGGQIKTGWRKACERAAITRPITPHGLRHTWASWHYAEHRDPLVLRRDGGWSSVALVERYAHLAPRGLAAEIIKWRVSRLGMARAEAA